MCLVVYEIVGNPLFNKNDDRLLMGQNPKIGYKEITFMQILELRLLK